MQHALLVITTVLYKLGHNVWCQQIPTSQDEHSIFLLTWYNMPSRSSSQILYGNWWNWAHPCSVTCCWYSKIQRVLKWPVE